MYTLYLPSYGTIFSWENDDQPVDGLGPPIFRQIHIGNSTNTAVCCFTKKHWEKDRQY